MVASDPYRGDHLTEVGADILKLKSSQLRKLAVIRIAQLTSGEAKGERLERMPDSWPTELRDCWKLYFDEQENDVGRRLNQAAPRYRIVYRFLDPVPDPRDRDRRPRLQVLAVGPRYQAEAYERAVSRLAQPAVAGERSVQPARRSPQRREQPAGERRRRAAQEDQRQQPHQNPARPQRQR
ncbi:hypothetical protein [Streptomyces canus]|uniref:hypothetical protein n=1 Tax=Streptomyces canus TaxID=58343 RepID=UPI00278812B6|nr:hypothetical protein [Streptomyces canus]MDQ0765672.1 hypothetical protein [Streptomyces canus]